MISTASAIRDSTSSRSTSSTSTSCPSILTTTGLPVLASIFGATTFGAGGAMSSSSTFLSIRNGEPSPALRNFSVATGTVTASARASSTKSLSVFFGMRLMDVTPRDSSSASTSFWRVAIVFASTMACTSFAVRSFLSSIFFGTTFLAGAFFAGAFLATTFFAGAFFTGFFFAALFFATAFFLPLFLSALNTATIVLLFFLFEAEEAMAIL